MSDVIVLDLETTIRNDEIGKNKASPWYLGNEVVYEGFHIIHKGSVISPVIITNTFNDRSKLMPHLCAGHRGVLTVVGQNVKFDLGYLIRNNEFRYKVFSGEIAVWDIQLAEAMMEGYKQRFPSLDYMCEKRGLPVKDDKIKDYWKRGVCTSKIPEEEIVPYIEADVNNTSIIYHDQIQKLQSNPRLLENITLQMEALVTTLLMEYNGIYFNTFKAGVASGEIAKEIYRLELTLKTHMEDSGMVSPNPSSTHQIAQYLFGAVVEYTDVRGMVGKDGKVVLFKSGIKKGQVRTHKVKYKKIIHAKYDRGVSVGRSTSDSALKDIMPVLPPIVQMFCRDLLELRKLKKELSTYYEGYTKHTWPYDSCIRTSFNHTATPTGRLSSTNPNIQNVTREDT